jgi:sigma-B regulation protein RsbU (phosphoserine phosphatase)
MATAICMSIDAGELVISSAGHPPAIIVSTDGRLREVPSAPDPMLGAFDQVLRRDHRIAVEVGELVVAFTDGVLDAPGEHDRFGETRLNQALTENAGSHARVTVAALESALSQFSVGGGDDIAVLALRRVQ